MHLGSAFAPYSHCDSVPPGMNSLSSQHCAGGCRVAPAGRSDTIQLKDVAASSGAVRVECRRDGV